MNRTKIDWPGLNYTWNPVIGCKSGCSYCYARAWAKRAGRSFEPVFSEGQYRKPYKIKEPSKIFVCSLADLFGDWIPKEWIERVLKVVKENPQHTFMFLTKNPKRYSEFDFPKNCQLGMTITGANTYKENADILGMAYLKNYKFASIEPLLGMIDYPLNIFDLVIVGAMTGAGAIEPKKEWIDSIKHPNIFYKSNIKPFLAGKQKGH